MNFSWKENMILTYPKHFFYPLDFNQNSSNSLSNITWAQHYLSRDALAPGLRSSKKINKFWKWLKLAKTIRFGFIVLFYIWEPWDVCWFSSDFHKMSIANHLLTKWNWMLWLVTDLRKNVWELYHSPLYNTSPVTAASRALCLFAY